MSKGIYTVHYNEDQTLLKSGKCILMSNSFLGGIPVQAFYILGGFMPEGQTTLPASANYEEASTVMMSILLDNFDPKSKSEQASVFFFYIFTQRFK